MSLPVIGTVLTMLSWWSQAWMGMAVMENAKDIAQEALVAIEKNKRTLREVKNKSS